MIGRARRKCESSTTTWPYSCATLKDRAALAKTKDGVAGLGGRTRKQEIDRSDSWVVNASVRGAEPLRDCVPRVGGQSTTEAMITMSSAARPSDIQAPLESEIWRKTCATFKRIGATLQSYPAHVCQSTKITRIINRNGSGLAFATQAHRRQNKAVKNGQRQSVPNVRNVRDALKSSTSES